eukprot:3887814-Lingulodinium_polyedra.AAC.1
MLPPTKSRPAWTACRRRPSVQPSTRPCQAAPRAGGVPACKRQSAVGVVRVAESPETCCAK